MEISYKTYTVKEVRAWLYEGVQNGLSEQIITKTRANSIIHNPYVKDDMVIVVAAFYGENVVGFTAMFPEHLIKPDIWISIGTTLYADPCYTNEYLGYNLVKILHDASEGRYVVGSDVAPAAAVIDKLLGMRILSFNRTRYVLKRNIRIVSVRSLISWMLEPYRLLKQMFFIWKLYKYNDRNCDIDVVDSFDNETYNFILGHSENCTFIRSLEMLNWIAKFPFRVETVQETKSCNAFSDKCKHFQTYIVKVLHDNLNVGLFMIAVRDKDAHILLQYTERNFKDFVFFKIIDFVLKLKVCQLYSVYDDLNKYMENSNVSLTSSSSKFTYTIPKDILIDGTLVIQGADGDMFA